MRPQVAVPAADIEDRAIVQVRDFAEDAEAGALAGLRFPAQSAGGAASAFIRPVPVEFEDGGLVEEIHRAMGGRSFGQSKKKP